jgi:hypothetical protein
MEKIINKIKQFRIIGYILIGVGLYQRGIPTETLIVEMFLLVLLGELGSRKSPKEYQKEIKSSSNPTDSLRGTKKDSAPRTTDTPIRTRVRIIRTRNK